MPNLSVQYGENAREIIITVFKNRKAVTRIVTDKSTGLTVTEVYKEGIKKPVERYVYNKIV